jgi:hypothetical protein
VGNPPNVSQGRRAPTPHFLCFFAYTGLVPTVRTCVVSFTDSEGIRHAVEVAATSLYEAAALAINEFRRCGFTANAPGPATRLTVTVKTPATSHEVRLSKNRGVAPERRAEPERTGNEGEAEGATRFGVSALSADAGRDYKVALVGGHQHIVAAAWRSDLGPLKQRVVTPSRAASATTHF